MATLNDVITKLNETKVAKAGDTMRGRLAFSNGGFIDKYVSADGNERLAEVGGGSAWNTGAILRLNDNDSNYDTGGFRLSTGNDIALKGSQNGALTWNGKPINVGGVYITQTWVSGTSWYRVWSDGYIEQGGKINGVDQKYTLTFPRSFSNTNYTILKTLNWKDSTTGGIVRWYFGFWDLTQTTASTYCYTSPNGFTEDWIACGY